MTVNAPRARSRLNRRTQMTLVVAMLGYLLALIIIAPYVIMMFVALMPKEELFSPPLHVVPRGIDLSNFVIPWTDFPLQTYFRNSLIIAMGAVVLGLLVSIPAAHALARIRFRFKPAIMLLLLMTQMLSPAMLILGIYEQFRHFGLLDNLAAVISVNVAFSLGFAVLILTDVFESIPTEIEEAAAVDGASRLRTLISIVLPLAGPGIAVAGVFLFAQAWNEFTLALTVLNDPELTPLSIGLYQFYGQFDKEWTYLFATAAMGAIPVIVAFIYMERWLVRGLTAGSVK
ncbi:MAG: carbohydrate ABC transporter permease [Rhodobacter sp.]|nr:carbohydrate ABC transporter permease [Rhodobacter sp.]MCA3515287.1 carbohydrate ABC transporter permease [Rhodobacter sp.]